MAHPHGKKDIINQSYAETLGTLATKTALLANLSTITQNFRPSSYKGVVTGVGMALDEAVTWGIFAPSDLTVTEVAEALNTVVTDDRARILREQAGRSVQPLGFISSVPRAFHENRLPMFTEDGGYGTFCYNPSAASLTTGGVASGQFRIFGRWSD